MRGKVGEANSGSKLTAEKVRELRALEGTMTQVALAERFEISVAQVNRILRGQMWKSLL